MSQGKQRVKNVLMFLPNMVLLSARLLTDPRVPRTEKALVAGAIIYAVIPFDLIPDMIPFVGQLDDAYLIALTLLRLVDRTDPDVLRAHWNGGGDIVQLAESMVAVTAKLLPKRIRRVLTARVETAKDSGREQILPKPLLVVHSDDERRVN
jgi:uncharacterized membrane protein YkvA (DUF1232 family)